MLKSKLTILYLLTVPFYVNGTELPFSLPSEETGIISANEEKTISADHEENKNTQAEVITENKINNVEVPIQIQHEPVNNNVEPDHNYLDQELTSNSYNAPPKNDQVVFVDANFNRIPEEKLKQIVLHNSATDLTLDDQKKFQADKEKKTAEKPVQKIEPKKEPAPEKIDQIENMYSINGFTNQTSSRVISSKDFEKFKR